MSTSEFRCLACRFEKQKNINSSFFFFSLSLLTFLFCQSFIRTAADASVVDHDACLNVNCNYGQCLIAEHDGKAYCRCLPGYVGEQCLDIESENAREIIEVAD